MKITRKQLRQLIAEASIPRHRKYVYRDTRNYLSRAEDGGHRPRFKMPERGMRPSHNGYLALQVMKLPREQYETMLGELEAKHGDIHSWDVNAKIVYFRDGHQEKLA